ncbi:dynamin family protein [Aquibacillus koreensis]|uniref:Dynamin family protein n=1 Tax=Aquibacillus koreensis TaxID=279446 RepID=A0A9X3WPN1_9BACI|nr:dynamin family protein [Aquibacillus koreensis]MCT2536373.1 dynamin family protein [Aquibacillus koreensis]MDC3421276.1 dynamin family protein [Aquibacillus koreensis]
MISSVTKLVEASQIAALYDEFMKSEHVTQANKALDLLEKFDRNELVLCFAGHFSAGKSSMINHLLEEEILPNSPIPTSANVVKITSGGGYAKVYFNQENPVEYKEPYDLNQIKQFCKDGDSINKVEINKKTSIIPNDVAILDTPGIDSSNDADRIMTESSLHTVDVVFYVMDYNHVQSEVNLTFLRDLEIQGIPTYVVINQIDKHSDHELTFKQFKDSVNHVFAEWGIHPKHTFYTSLKDLQAPNNQYSKLKQEFQQLMTNHVDRIEETIQKSLQVLIEKHLDWVALQYEEQKESLENVLNELKPRLPHGDQNHLESEMSQLEEIPKIVESGLKSLINTTLQNAYLMPFEVREHADALLKSYQDGFKVGLLSTKKKVDVERQTRLDAFYDALKPVIDASLEWKIREKLSTFAKENDITNPKIIHHIQALQVPFEKESLVDLIKTGAGMTGEYLLVYTDDIANEVKRKAQEASFLIRELMMEEKQEQVQGKIQKLKDQLDLLTKMQAVETELSQIDEKLNAYHAKLNALLQDKLPNNSLVKEVRKVIENRENEVSLSPVPPKEDTDDVTEAFEQGGKKDTRNVRESVVNVDTAIKHIELTLNQLHLLPGLQTIEKDLMQKKQRLENRQYTVALFGAFSAGKSSFSNALMGESVLPVSPNPTTAAINKISAPTDNYKNKTVVVKVKDKRTILTDIQSIMYEDQEHLDGQIDKIAKELLQVQTITQKQRSFLHAVLEGYDQLFSNLGREITISFEELSTYVSKESLACYVEWMELYYDCALTRQGITLVDTPGADSVNARHTDVAFQYIKQADAILFVTYYNHAFTQADRTFLMQLGRVKDAFSLDKMFFIVNAADLAKDEEELELVKTYVREQLQIYGVTNPKMYALSSHLALKEKQANDHDHQSGIKQFEKDFDSFINQDLMQILIQSALYDINRSHTQLEKYIYSAQLNNDEKQALLSSYKGKEQSVKEVIKEEDSSTLAKGIDQKIDKQLYYVHERLSIQFGDRFKQAFNPSTIQSNGKQAKVELDKCLSHLLHAIGIELAEELRAVSLRIEAFINERAREFNALLDQRSKKVEPDLALPQPESYQFETPNFDQAFQDANRGNFQKALATFKNTKSFFEKNEKEVMKDELWSSISPLVEVYIAQNNAYMQSYYREGWSDFCNLIRDHAQGAIDTYFEGIYHSLTEGMDVDKLQSAKDHIEAIIRNFEQ